MLFLAKLDEGEGGNNNADEESDDDEVEDDSVRTFCLLVRLFFTPLVYRCITINFKNLKCLKKFQSFLK